MTYGQRFRELRKQLGLEQDDVAELMFGNRKMQGNIAAIEATAGRIPRHDTVLMHARVLKCQPSELLQSVDDTWIDRVRRGEYDGGEQEDRRDTTSAADPEFPNAAQKESVNQRRQARSRSTEEPSRPRRRKRAS